MSLICYHVLQPSTSEYISKVTTRELKSQVNGLTTRISYQRFGWSSWLFITGFSFFELSNQPPWKAKWNLSWLTCSHLLPFDTNLPPTTTDNAMLNLGKLIKYSCLPAEVWRHRLASHRCRVRILAKTERQIPRATPKYSIMCHRR